MEHLKTLFIDDTEGDNDYIRLLIDIQKLPITPQYALSGIQALDYLKTKINDGFPQVIMVDINMPLMNGFEFIEEFEKQFYPSFKEVKIFVMSSSHRLSEIEKAKSIPIVTDFIQKPLTKEIFEQKVLELFNIPSSSQHTK